MVRTGRRPGGGGTREVILDAARAAFAEHGYDRAGLRAIADAAGVDPALVYHYFKGGKQELFVAAMHFPMNPATLLGSLLTAGPERLGEGVVRTVAGLWDDPATRAPFLGLIRTAISSERAAAMIREFITEAMVGRIVKGLGMPDAALRATLVGSQVGGLVMIRYILRVEPLASLPTDDLVAAVAPNIQRYLTGDLGLPGGKPPEAPAGGDGGPPR